MGLSASLMVRLTYSPQNLTFLIATEHKNIKKGCGLARNCGDNIS
jgi:hypothetical protein